MSNQENMANFIRELFDEFYPDCGDIDGGTLQDMAEKHGIIIPETVYKPCEEECNCAQVCSDSDFAKGISCYRLADWLLK